MTDSKSDDHRPMWDSKIASELSGAIVYVGITYVDHEDKPTFRIEFYGLVTEVDESRGIAIDCHNDVHRGQTFWLPPDLRAFHRAKPGNYKLESTGENLVDPDFTTKWIMTEPKDQPQ